MKDFKNQILFDKYQVIDSLGSGSFGQVIKVRHISLDQIRAIKIVPHNQTDYESKFHEALLLKSINYLGIPQIYDIFDDDEYLFIVEEYIPGEALDKFLLHQSNISIGLFLNFCEQLCNIFIYLHSFKPLPIVYRDLKPEHVIVEGLRLYLIDFGISNFACDNQDSADGNNSKSYGNLLYSAPEVYDTNTFTTHSDIYSVGKLIAFLQSYVEKGLSRNFTHIIQKSTNPNPDFRYETVEDLLRDIKNEYSNIFGSHPCKSIAVVGTNSGCGVTHISVSIVTELNFLGYKAIYKEDNNSRDLQNCALYQPGMYEKAGIIKHHFFQGIPQYGPGIIVNAPDYNISVTDYGVDFTRLEILDADLIIMVCGGAYWNISPSVKLHNYFFKVGIKPLVIVNTSQKSISHTIARELNCPVFSYSHNQNPFSPDSEKRKFIKQLVNRKEDALFLKRRKKLFQRK